MLTTMLFVAVLLLMAMLAFVIVKRNQAWKMFLFYQERYESQEEGFQEFADSYEQQFLTFMEKIQVLEDQVFNQDMIIAFHNANCLPTVEGDPVLPVFEPPGDPLVDAPPNSL